MVKTLTPEMAFIGLVITAFVLVAPSPVGAQTTPWGDPDLRGVWTNQTPVPLERPDALAGKAFFTEEEAAEFEKTALERLLNALGPTVSTTCGECNDIWLETADGKVAPSRSTSLVTDPPDGKIPYTLEGKKRWEVSPTNDDRQLAANGPEDRSYWDRCLTTNALLMPNPFYSNYHHIFQTREYVAIVSEVMHEVRVIPLDERPHLDPRIGQWLGDSRGWWEDQTLVVETTNFNDKRLFRGATEHLRLVERFTRLDANTVNYRLTVTDPATFARPWTLENALRKADGPLYEFACHEGNYSMTGILAGARAEEKR